jgi:hypothetical protein
MGAYKRLPLCPFVPFVFESFWFRLVRVREWGMVNGK